MIRRSQGQSRALLTLNRLEERDVPASLIDVSLGSLGANPELSIVGDNTDHHIRVEMPDPFTITVSSDTGPIRYFDSQLGQSVITDQPVVFTNFISGYDSTICNIQTGNGNDTIQLSGGSWRFVGIRTGNGDDSVSIEEANFFESVIFTGNGNDSVSIRDSVSTTGLSIRTEQGDDRISLSGTNRFALLDAQLGQGNDILEGDSDPQSSLSWNSLVIGGGEGFDQLLNADYFLGVEVNLPLIDGIEFQD